jgi:hypothetical protein
MILFFIIVLILRPKFMLVFYGFIEIVFPNLPIIFFFCLWIDIFNSSCEFVIIIC